jgi:integrase
VDRKFLTEEEVSDLFAVIKSPRDRAIFRVAYHRGLRASEVGMLRLEDFRRGSGRLLVRRLKGSRTAEFPLVAAELASLRAWLRVRGDAPGPLFLSRHKRAISRRMLDVLMRRYCAEAGVPEHLWHFHSLKHSCGTHVYDRTGQLDITREWLGHVSIQSTEIYAQMSERRMVDAAERLRDWGRR